MWIKKAEDPVKKVAKEALEKTPEKEEEVPKEKTVDESEEPRKRSRKPSEYVIHRPKEEDPEKQFIFICDKKPKSLAAEDVLYRVQQEIFPKVSVIKRKNEKDHVSELKKIGAIVYVPKEYKLGNINEIDVPIGQKAYVLKKVTTTGTKAWYITKDDVPGQFLAHIDGGSTDKSDMKHDYLLSDDGSFLCDPKMIMGIYDVQGRLIFGSPTKGAKQKIAGETYLFVENEGPFCYHDIKEDSKYRNKTIFVLGKKYDTKISL